MPYEFPDTSHTVGRNLRPWRFITSVQLEAQNYPYVRRPPRLLLNPGSTVSLSAFAFEFLDLIKPRVECIIKSHDDSLLPSELLKRV
jgi:hypothetical protein